MRREDSWISSGIPMQQLKQSFLEACELGVFGEEVFDLILCETGFFHRDLQVETPCYV